MSPLARCQAAPMPRLLWAVLAMVVVLAQTGCVQRNLEFNCQGLDESEMAMTPTSLQFKGVSYAFQEESGAWRSYEAGDTRPPIRFNTSSGELVLGEWTWTCRKYEALLERVN
jgi:hypothetical protein